MAPNRYTLQYNRLVRVAIVGAGVIGAAIADELASRGAAVRVFDPRPPGRGATHASAGMLAPYIEGHGPDLLSLCLASFELYGGFVARIERQSGIPVEYGCDGALQVAYDEVGRREIEDTCRRLAAAGAEHERLEGSEVRRLEPGLSPAIGAGLFVRPHGYVNVDGLMAALVGSASRHGTEFVSASVDTVEGGEDGAVVVTAAGRFAADAVVVAGGSWSGRIPAGGMTVPVRPVRGQLVHLRFDEPPVSRMVWGSRCYLVPWRDGSLLLGATVEDVGFDERPTVAGVSALLEGGRQLLPGLADAAFQEVRVGLRPATGDELPVIGRSPTMPRVFHATGHYRNGVLLAPLTAVLVADLVLEGREGEALADTSPGRSTSG